MSIPIPYISRDSAVLLSVQEVESDTCSLFIRVSSVQGDLEFKRDGRVCLHLLKDFVMWVLNCAGSNEEKVHSIMEVF